MVWTLCGVGALVVADYDLTGQLVWPGAGILNDYLVNHSHLLDDISVIELGSGVGKKSSILSFWRDHQRSMFFLFIVLSNKDRSIHFERIVLLQLLS